MSKTHVGVFLTFMYHGNTLLFCVMHVQVCEVLAKHVVVLPDDEVGRKKVVTACFMWS